MVSLKQTAALALLTASGVNFIISPTKAAQTQVNQQSATQTAAAVGSFNDINQDLTQLGIQGQAGLFAPAAQMQVNQQNAAQSAAAIGTGNNINQTLNQISDQYQLGW